jgi:hypothetical protein
MKPIPPILLLMSLWGCQPEKGKITFYIENGSQVDSLISFKVLLDDHLTVVDTLFKYAPIAPNYDIFRIDYPLRDSVLIRASTNTGAQNAFKIRFDKDAYVFMAYVHDSLMTEEARRAYEEMKKELPGYDPSELLAKKGIQKMVQYTEPILY